MTQNNANPFRKAEKERTHLRMALYGASGSGKTLTALNIAQGLGGKIAVIDTEHGNASIYGDRVDFDVLELTEYHPQRYIDAINAAASAGYNVLIIDSLSHAWFGTGGLLEIVDKAAAKSESKNSYAAWRFATPVQNKLIEAIIAAPMHLICTMRSKTEYVLEKDERGKSAPRKVGTTPIQREGLEYEFRIVAKMNAEHQLSIDKTHYPELDGEVVDMPSPSFGERLKVIVAQGSDPQPRHWVLNGGGARFSERMKALNLPPDYVLAFLEPDRAIERLSETELDEAAALARLDELAAQRQDVPTPPPASPAADPDLSGASASGASDDPIANYGQELGAVITATRPDEQTADEDYKAYACHKVLIQTKGKRRDFIFKSDDGHKFTVPEAKVNNLKTEVIMWSPGKPHDLPVTVWVEARPDGDDWDVRSVSDEVQP